MGAEFAPHTASIARRVAARDCKSLAPAGGLHRRPTAAQTAQNLALLLRYARCMRAAIQPQPPRALHPLD